MDENLKEVVIPKEYAVFWMDGNGCWRNVHGKFRRKQIIDKFNNSIRRDESGYFVTQINGERIEKVYFRCEETAFFASDIHVGDHIDLVLNTGNVMRLDAASLFIRNDSLYLNATGYGLIKFTERCLMKIFKMIEFSEGQYRLAIGGEQFPIPEMPLDDNGNQSSCQG